MGTGRMSRFALHIQAEQWQIPVFYNVQDLRVWVEKSA
jgi:hypothetical protein